MRTSEELDFAGEAVVLARGYNGLAFDGPGEASTRVASRPRCGLGAKRGRGATERKSVVGAQDIAGVWSARHSASALFLCGVLFAAQYGRCAGLPSTSSAIAAQWANVT
jgi:hypothetical protein